MRVIPTRALGAYDYFMGLLIATSPWYLNYNHGGAETIIPVIIGIATIIYSLCTDYELGVFRIIPTPTNLVLNMLGGLVLAASPWLFEFYRMVWAPHLIFGLLGITMSFITKYRPSGCKTCHG